MNHKRALITDGPTLSIQACDDGVWLHFTTLDGKRHCSLNLPVKFAEGTYLYDSIICQWAKDFAIKNEDAPQKNIETGDTTHNSRVMPCAHWIPGGICNVFTNNRCGTENSCIISAQT